MATPTENRLVVHGATISTLALAWLSSAAQFGHLDTSAARVRHFAFLAIASVFILTVHFWVLEFFESRPKTRFEWAIAPLIAVLSIVMSVGFLCLEVNRSRSQLHAVDTLEARGAKFVFLDRNTEIPDYSYWSWFDRTLEQRLGLWDERETVVRIALGGAVDSDVDEIVRLRSLESLDLTGARLSEGAFAKLAQLPELTTLVLTNSNLEAGGMRELVSAPRLNGLVLDGTFVDDNAVESIMKMKALSYINVRNTRMSDYGVRHLKNWGQCTVIYDEDPLVFEGDLESE